MNLNKLNVLKAAGRCLCTKPTTNCEIKPFVYNRNPRNLERMRLARKPTGYQFEEQLVEYWHKLTLSTNNRGGYVTAKLTHNSGFVVVSASTSEWAIKKFLYSCSDTQAYIILARVFAQRCFESGINCMESDVIYEDGTKAEIFLKELLKEGVSLNEPTVFSMEKKWDVVREKKPWTVLE